DIVCEMPLYSFRPEDFGSYQERYQYPMEDTIRWESHFEDEKVKTLMQSSYWSVSNWQTLGDSNQLWREPGTASLRALIPQFGVRGEKVEPWGFIHSKEAAAYYAHVKLSQLNADAWRQSVGCVMHLGVGPNRPCWFECRDFIATTRGATDAIVWGKSGS